MPMPSTTSYNRGAILLARLPNVEGTLLLSGEAYNRSGSDLIVALITSNIGSPSKPGDYLVRQWSEAGLLRSSRIRARVSTIHRAKVVGVLGHVSETDLRAYEAGFESAMELCR